MEAKVKIDVWQGRVRQTTASRDASLTLNTMSDDEMASNERPPLFFAGSDDEDENEDVAMEPPADGPDSSSPSRASSRLISVGGSDDEKDDTATGPQKRPINVDDDSDPEIQCVEPQTPPKPRAASAGPSRKSSKTSAPPAKKRRVSSPTPPDFPPTYIGEVVFGHAWSNVSGKGYIKIGEEVKIMREPQEDAKKSATKKTGDGKKQMSIHDMMKKPAKTTKKKADTIVRLYNSRGFGVFSL